jgi:hypothetical protein
VEVVEGEVERGRWHGRLRRKAPPTAAVEKQKERHAMVGLIVGRLSEELFTELMQGFHVPREG